MQNIQRSLVDRRSLNGLQVIRLHYNTADDIQKYMTVIRESIKVIEIGLLFFYYMCVFFVFIFLTGKQALTSHNHLLSDINGVLTGFILS